MAFIDYKNGHTTVQIPAVLEAIWRQRVEEVYCKMLEDTKMGQQPPSFLQKQIQYQLKKVLSWATPSYQNLLQPAMRKYSRN